MKETIKSIIKDFHKRGFPELIERDINVPIKSGKIVSIIGARRAGKTYLLYQVMKRIKDITNIIYINFEDERLNISSKDLNLILESYFEMYPDKKEKDLFFFFDEIQEIDGWEKFIRRIYDTISKDIFITGSSAKLLSKEIATSLRGRTITYKVFPLSFKEYLEFNNIEADIDSTKGKAKLLSVFTDFLFRGSFPETVGMDKEVYEKTLNNYFEVMVYRDIVERHNITSIQAIKIFIKRLLGDTGKEFSIHKIYNNLKSEGVKVSKDSLYNFLDYCEDAYLIMHINNFSESMSKQIIKKSYSIDTGLSSMISFTLSKDKGRLLENCVFLELKRNNKEIYFFKDRSECDFIIKEKDKIVEAIQVSYDLNKSNEEREFSALKDAMKKFNLKKGLIITKDKEQTVGNIKVIPAYKWLLGSM